MRTRRTSILVSLIVAAVALVTRTPARADHAPPPGEAPGLVVGEFDLPRQPVVDGDTIHVVGLPKSLRLLAIDTEETFKHDSERADYRAGWDGYLKKMRGDSPHPVKMATPLGEDAKTFAIQFFSGVDRVRLERDTPGQIHDYYGRYLAYVFAKKDGKWVNYNLEAVRAGMTPYFTKYGYSRRFHDEFVAAEAEARAAKRGIWDPARQHYPDYAERKAWWDARADFVRAFEADAAKDPSLVSLADGDALERMPAGKEVVLLGAVGDMKQAGRGPVKVFLGMHKGADFPLIFFDRRVLEQSGIPAHLGEYVRARGKVELYNGKELELVVRSADQITVSGPTSTARGPWNDDDDSR
jgi:endonuclease YncB( thermonuclease family)